MCPLCLSSLVMAALGSASAGGVTALAVKRFRARKTRKSEEPLPERKESKP